MPGFRKAALGNGDVEFSLLSAAFLWPSSLLHSFLINILDDQSFLPCHILCTLPQPLYSHRGDGVTARPEDWYKDRTVSLPGNHQRLFICREGDLWEAKMLPDVLMVKYKPKHWCVYYGTSGLDSFLLQGWDSWSWILREPFVPPWSRWLQQLDRHSKKSMCGHPRRKATAWSFVVIAQITELNSVTSPL